MTPCYLQTGTSALTEVFKTADSTDMRIREQSMHSLFKVLKQQQQKRKKNFEHWKTEMLACIAARCESQVSN